MKNISQRITTTKISYDNIKSINLDAYMELLRHEKKCSTDEKIKETFENSIRVCSYIQKKHGAQTYGQVLKLLENGAINEKVIEIWIEYKMLIYEAGSVEKGYSQYIPEIQEMLNKAFT